jgi:hypothetical protein
MASLQARRLPTRWFALALVPLLLCGLSSCSHQIVNFPYPAETIVYPGSGGTLPRIHISRITDQRPDDQRKGQGHFTGITFPSDESWDPAVSDIYRDALTRDIAQTQLAELTPLPAQAAYTIEAVIHSFHCRMERSGVSFLLPTGVGMLGGFMWGDDTSGRMKRGAALGIVALGVIPVPLHVMAEAEVELILRDSGGEIVWQEVCIHVVEDDRGVPAVSRPDKSLAEKYMPQAVKRCNACLLGQLRQFLFSRNES